MTYRYARLSQIPFTGKTRPFWSTTVLLVLSTVGTFLMVHLYSKHELDYRKYRGIQRTTGQDRADEFVREVIQKAISEYL